MTDKEFKRLSRAQLIEIIYQFQLREEELQKENQKLKEELADKRVRLEKAGNIAEAVLEVNNVMQAAQNAAAQYVEEIRALRGETEEYCRRTIEKARQEAAQIRAGAGEKPAADPFGFEAILKEYTTEM